jgi:hypothetical protein
LFNGKDLSGWKMSDPSATPTWKVESGTLASPGHGPELISNAKFYRAELPAEIVGFGSKLLRGVLGLLKLCEVFGALNY